MIAYCKRCGTSHAVERIGARIEFVSMRSMKPVGHCTGCGAVLSLDAVRIEQEKRRNGQNGARHG